MLLQEHVTPLLRGEGFRKSAHTYRLALPGGDWLMVSFTGFPIGTWGSFHVDVAFVPQPVVEMQNWEAGKRLDAPPGLQPGYNSLLLWHPAYPRGWRFDSENERQNCIAVLTDALPGAVRVLRLLANRDVLLDVVRAPLPPVSADLTSISHLCGGSGGLRMALLVERGPAPELQPFLDFYAGGPFSRLTVWATARLDAGHPLALGLQEARQPRSSESYRPLQRALDEALDRLVTPAMTAAGFRRIAGGYERTTTAGDRAAVDVRLSATATEELLAFTVVTGLDPAPSRAFQRHLRESSDRPDLTAVNPPNRTMNWLLSVLRPTPAFSSPIAALEALGLHPWAVPVARIDEGFRLLAHTLAEASAPFLTSMLDRRTLAEFLPDPAHRGYQEPFSEDIQIAMLLLDGHESATELASRLASIRRRPGPSGSAFLTWVQDHTP